MVLYFLRVLRALRGKKHDGGGLRIEYVYISSCC